MISDNIREVKTRIKDAARRVNRDPDSITLVSVTKEASINDILEAINAGITDVGENRVQDALIKYNKLKSKDITWHMIGHLQTNKAKDAFRIFKFIHSVDSLKLALELNKEAARQQKLARILIQVNTSGEASKFGVSPLEIMEMIEDLTGLSNIVLTGLMTMAPYSENAQESRPHYRRLKEIFDEVNKKIPGLNLKYLSMGMTQDFEVAIEEGANIVRVGRAIFKPDERS